MQSPTNNQNFKTMIAFILDRSGSMATMTQAAIDGFNEFLFGQQQTHDDDGKPLPADLTLILFDNEYFTIYDRMPIAEALPLSHQTYQPRGSTALLDAVGRTIDELGATLATMPETARPHKVIVAILTDGEENSSRRYCASEIREKINHQTTVYSWEFLFLAANQDAFATADAMGISRNMASSFIADDDDLQTVQKSISMKMSAMRKYAAQMQMSVNEDAILRESMSDTLERGRCDK